jgi:hypothetical protein
LDVNLNESFLAISFEATTEAGEMESGMSAAQLRSVTMPIEMLCGR